MTHHFKASKLTHRRHHRLIDHIHNLNHGFLVEISRKMSKSIEENIKEGLTTAYMEYVADDFNIIISTDNYDNVNVEICSDKDKEYPNVEDAVRLSIPSWDKIAEKIEEEKEYDEWNEHGFRDESDYTAWRYGRCL